MKNLRNYYAAFLLFALLFVAAASPSQARDLTCLRYHL